MKGDLKLPEIDLIENDVHYISFVLKEKDLTTGAISVYDLSNVSQINFYMRQYGSTVNTIEATCEVVTATLGLCRVRVTVPTEGTYSSQIEVIESGQTITWKGPIINVIGEI